LLFQRGRRGNRDVLLSTCELAVEHAVRIPLAGATNRSESRPRTRVSAATWRCRKFGCTSRAPRRRPPDLEELEDTNGIRRPHGPAPARCSICAERRCPPRFLA